LDRKFLETGKKAGVKRNRRKPFLSLVAFPKYDFKTPPPEGGTSRWVAHWEKCGEETKGKCGSRRGNQQAKETLGGGETNEGGAGEEWKFRASH